MLIEVDPTSELPPYEQLRVQVTAMVLTGELPVGERLPSIRQLAGDLGLATGTVARAYRELEADGVVRSRGARGTTVVGPPRLGGAGDDVMGAAQGLAEAAARSELDLEAVLTLVRITFAARRAQA